MIQSSKYQKHILRVSFLLCIVSLLLVLFLGNTYANSSSDMLEKAKINAKSQAEYAVDEIDVEISKLKTISEDIAYDLSTGELESDKVGERLKDTLVNYPMLKGAFVAYKPYEYDPLIRLHGLYFLRNVSIQQIQIEDKYDYTLPDGEQGVSTNWYHQPLLKGPCWVGPYFGSAGQTFFVNYNVPFYRINSSELDTKEIGNYQELLHLTQSPTNAGGLDVAPVGVVGTEYSLESMRDLVGSLDLGDTGYGFIITEDGTVVSHPIQDYLGRNVIDLQKTDETLRVLTQNIDHGQHQDIYNEFTGQSSWVFYESIPSTNWTLGVVFFEEEEFQKSKNDHRHLKISFGMAIIAFLFFLSTIVFRIDKGNTRNLWIIVIIFSILCLSGMGFIWSITLDDPPAKVKQDVEIFDRVGIETALHKLSPSEEANMVRVPTGIFLQSIEFSSANNVIVTGYIWQKYSDGMLDDISSGFIFPEAESIDVEEAYREDGVIGWYFRAVLRQPFDYSQYPFDREDVWIRLWHKDFHRNIILVPDLGSYDTTNPDQKPGLERNSVLEGWDIHSSFFSYRNNEYNADFGVSDYRQELPELYFNVGMKRDFLTSIISDMIPIIVVSFLLFAVLIISTKSDKKINIYGFSSSTVLSYCAALFFVLIISHVSLREKLAATGIIYLECFYFILYFVLLVVSINSILLASDNSYGFIIYRDNLIIKLLYWPVVLATLLVITIINFY